MREMRGQFTKIFRTNGGVKVHAELGTPAGNNFQDNYRPRRTFTVYKTALVNSGDVVSSEGVSYLLSLANEFSNTKQFKAYPITHRVSWTRRVDAPDYVTGMPKDSALVILDPALPVVVEHGQVIQDLGIESNKYRVLCGADVLPGDRLGAWLVLSRTDLHGVQMLEVS